MARPLFRLRFLPLLVLLLAALPQFLCANQKNRYGEDQKDRYGTDQTNRFKPITRLVVLKDNAQGAKCLDGSPPAYYFRPGSGLGRNKWHVHLPTGGWCFTPGECLYRANSSLGSSRFWARRLPTVVENGGKLPGADKSWIAYPQLGGLLSQDNAANPAFATWNLVWVVYCDGGAYSSTRGRAAFAGGVTLYMQGQAIMKALLDDLRHKRGMQGATNILFSGSSAGGHAVMMQCDSLAAAFPRASTKCFADSGFFVDAKDRFGRYSWRDNVRVLTALHRIHVPNCPTGAGVRDHWVCFFPEHTLSLVRTPLFLFQSLFDRRFIQYESQLPPDNQEYSMKCLREQILVRDASFFARMRSWSQMQWRRWYCTRQEVNAVFSMAHTVYSRLKTIVRRKRSFGVFLAPQAVHAALFYESWFQLDLHGVKLSIAFRKWYGGPKRKGLFLF